MKLCSPCPWRAENVDKDVPDDVKAFALEHDGEGFICHVRCTACPGAVTWATKEKR